MEVELLKEIYEEEFERVKILKAIGFEEIVVSSSPGNWNELFTITAKCECPKETSNEAVRINLPELNLNKRQKVCKFYGFGDISQQTAGFVLEDFRRLYMTTKLILRHWKMIDNHQEKFLESIDLLNRNNAIELALKSFNPINVNLPKKPTVYNKFRGYSKLFSRLSLMLSMFENQPNFVDRFGIDPIAGFLIHGVSGVGKTHLVNSLLNQCSINYISAPIAKIYSKYLGESEAAIRSIFAIAKANYPCVIVFDHVDTLGGKRDLNSDTTGVEERVLSTLLNEMDGVGDSEGVFMIGITSKLDNVDDALVRPGRFDYIVEMGIPNEADRIEILKEYTGTASLSMEDLDALVEISENFTGADISAWCREAAMIAMEENREILIDDYFNVIQHGTAWRPSTN